MDDKNLKKAFWSPTRQMFLPLTISDVVNRLGITQTEAFGIIFKWMTAGIVEPKLHASGSDRVTTWVLTKAGKNEVLRQIEDEGK